MNKIRALKIYESENRRIQVSELMTVMREKNISQARLVQQMGWSWGYFSGLKRQQFAEIHKKDIENLLLFLESL